VRSLLLGRYIDGDSPAHRLDPRAKIVFLISLVAALFIGSTIEVQLLALACIALLTVVSAIPFRAVLSLLKTAAFFVFFTVLVHVLFTDSLEETSSIFGIGTSAEGLNRGLFYGTRLLSMLWIAALVSWTTAPIAFADAAERMLKPLARLRLPVREVSTTILLALRFIPTLTVDARELKFAQRSRGAAFGQGSPIARVRSVIPLIVPLFVGALRRAETTAVALTVRGFSSDSDRTSLYPLRFKFADILVLAVSIIGLSVGVYWKFVR